MRRTAIILSLVMLCAVNAASGAMLMVRGGGAIEIELNQDVTGETPGDQYKITLDEPGRYVVSMESVPEDMLTSIKVSGDAGIDFAAETETSVPGELAALIFEIAEPGTYNVEISELDGRECGPYTFEVTRYLGSKAFVVLDGW